MIIYNDEELKLITINFKALNNMSFLVDKSDIEKIIISLRDNNTFEYLGEKENCERFFRCSF